MRDQLGSSCVDQVSAPPSHPSCAEAKRTVEKDAGPVTATAG